MVAWRFSTTESGEQFVMINGQYVMWGVSLPGLTFSADDIIM